MPPINSLHRHPPSPRRSDLQSKTPREPHLASPFTALSPQGNSIRSNPTSTKSTTAAPWPLQTHIPPFPHLPSPHHLLFPDSHRSVSTKPETSPPQHPRKLLAAKASPNTFVNAHPSPLLQEPLPPAEPLRNDRLQRDHPSKSETIPPCQALSNLPLQSIP